MLDFLKKTFEILAKTFSLETLQRALKLPSAITLILANLIPVIGVIFFKWNAFDILILYWGESIVIGFFNFFRILLAKQSTDIQRPILYAFFFLFHFSTFVVAHGIFLKLLVWDKTSFFINHDYTGIWAFAIAIFISHGISFLFNYVKGKEYLYRSPYKQMMEPYGRIIIMQLTLILGTLLYALLPQGFFIIFIILKLLIDLSVHLNIHISKG